MARLQTEEERRALRHLAYQVPVIALYPALFCAGFNALGAQMQYGVGANSQEAVAALFGCALVEVPALMISASLLLRGLRRRS